MIGQAFHRLRVSVTSSSAAHWTLWVGGVQNRLGTFVLPFLAIYPTKSRHLGPVIIGLLTSLPGLALDWVVSSAVALAAAGLALGPGRRSPIPSESVT